jgi:putative SOS response-associated peptidase YedK
MCGRLDQNDIARLIRDFSWTDAVFNRSRAEDSFNVCPGSYRPVLHVDGDALFADDVFWGYRASWAEAGDKKIPVAINTRLEKITNRYWSGLLRRGRAIVPALGWYEWTGEKGSKQPWHVHRTDGAPIYLAALASFNSRSEAAPANGFTIVTADAEGGMVDIHDRRPVVLNEADAALWRDPDLPAEQAAHLLRSVALGPEDFGCFMVDRAVGNVRAQGAHLAAPSGA